MKTLNALLQEDVVLCILDCLVAPEASLHKFRGARPVLFSLAQTCRAFSRPSLDRLWYKLDSLDPLILSYATALSEESTKTPPSPAEWVIIHRYSHRIRELSLPSTWPSLSFLGATSLDPSPLVPNLRVLKWDPSILSRDRLLGFPPTILLIHRFLTPSLVSLSVSVTETADGTLQSFLIRHPFLCPNLTSITVDLGGRENESRTTIEILSQAITRYEHLEQLDISAPMDDAALTHVAMSPKLKMIAIILQAKPKVCIPSDITPFRNVQDLQMEVWDLDFFTTLLRPQDQMFRSFALSYRSKTTIESVSSFFAALASRQRTHSLRSIRFSPNLSKDGVPFSMSSEIWYLSFYPYFLSFDTFRPLASLSHLRQLHLDFVLCISLDDDDLISMARNWPSLQVLHLNPKSRFEGEAEFVYPSTLPDVKYVTLQGLVSLIECCPDLRELCLPIDAREVPDCDTPNVVCHPALWQLRFPDSPISDARLVQGVLTRYFPSVSNVRYSFELSSDPDGDDEEIVGYHDLWDAVNVHLLERHFPLERSEL